MLCFVAMLIKELAMLGLRMTMLVQGSSTLHRRALSHEQWTQFKIDIGLAGASV